MLIIQFLTLIEIHIQNQNTEDKFKIRNICFDALSMLSFVQKNLYIIIVNIKVQTLFQLLKTIQENYSTFFFHINSSIKEDDFDVYPLNSILLEMQKNKNGVQPEIVKYRLLNPSVEQKLNLMLEETLSSYRKNEFNSTMQIQEPEKIQYEDEKISKMGKKVSFESLRMRDPHSYNKIKRSNLKGANLSSNRKSTYPLNSKTVSLNCSIVKPFIHEQTHRSTRSTKMNQSQAMQLKSLMHQIIKKISVFTATQITHNQILEWLHEYCKKQKTIILKLFIKHKAIKIQKSRKIQKHIYELQTDDKILMGKIESKHKDIYLGIDRYIRSSELKQFSQAIQLAFLDKIKIKAKEFEDSISKKMKVICQKIRKQKDNQYAVNFRKKPTQISKFITDFYDFQQNYGSLKKINTLSKMRFKIFNDTDLLIDRKLQSINESIQTQKMIQQQIRIIS